MEALSLLRFWRPITSTTIATQMPDLLVESDDGLHNVVGEEVEEGEEEEDSFFELELTVPDSDVRECSTSNGNKNVKDGDFVQVDSNREKQSSPKSTTTKSSRNHRLSHQSSLSLRKILPIDPCSRPQSPISLLKSAPKFRVFMFRKSKSLSASSKGAEKTGDDDRELRSRGVGLFTLKFKAREVQRPDFGRSNSSTRSETGFPSRSPESFIDSSSKRFSKDVVQKYLKLVKPLYVMISRKQTDAAKLSGEFSAASSPAMPPPFSSKMHALLNSPAGFPAVPKRLGKSRSASASGGVSPPARRDDTLVQQHDGIEGAIQHCKRSFNSSSASDCSPSSRFAGGPGEMSTFESGTSSSEEASQPL